MTGALEFKDKCGEGIKVSEYLGQIWASSQQNLSSGFPKKLDSNQPAQLHRLA